MKQSLRQILGLALIASFLIPSCMEKEGNTGRTIEGNMSSTSPGMCIVQFDERGMNVARMVASVGMLSGPGSYDVEATSENNSGLFEMRVPAEPEEGKTGAQLSSGSTERTCAVFKTVTIYIDGVANVYGCNIDNQRENRKVVCSYLNMKERR